MPRRTAADAGHDREILRLAVPAFLALVAEPLFLLADAAIIGHLGTPELAGLGIAGAVVQTVVGLCIFLAYGTTASVARRLGAGDTRGALAQGIDGIWLAVLIGVVTTVLGVLLTDPLVALFGPGPEVAEQAGSYLRVAFLGVTPLLVMLAATGSSAVSRTPGPRSTSRWAGTCSTSSSTWPWSTAWTWGWPAPRSAPTWPSSAPRRRWSWSWSGRPGRTGRR